LQNYIRKVVTVLGLLLVLVSACTSPEYRLKIDAEIGGVADMESNSSPKGVYKKGEHVTICILGGNLVRNSE